LGDDIGSGNSADDKEGKKRTEFGRRCTAQGQSLCVTKSKKGKEKKERVDRGEKGQPKKTKINGLQLIAKNCLWKLSKPDNQKRMEVFNRKNIWREKWVGGSEKRVYQPKGHQDVGAESGRPRGFRW